MPFPLLAFIVIPIAELLLLFEVADLIGGLATLGLVIVTAFVGINVLRIQGFSTLSRANQRMAGGELPGQEIVEGMLLAFAGALLLTPGLITDAIGFALLTPPIRRKLALRLMRSGTGFFVGGMSGRTSGFGAGFSGYRGRSGAGPDKAEGTTVDGEIVDRDDHDGTGKLSGDDKTKS
ncbi:MAG: FxsA family protein [Pseudohongiella sp.]|uniref:FxsA family protein n=1 Tax=Pseudohongiella sp. TaxID=1979412 RepID=UPI0034A09056